MTDCSVTINSDRAHIVLDGAPVETIMFSIYMNEGNTCAEDARTLAIGIAVSKSIKLNNGREVKVKTSIK